MLNNLKFTNGIEIPIVLIHFRLNTENISLNVPILRILKECLEWKHL